PPLSGSGTAVEYLRRIGVRADRSAHHQHPACGILTNEHARIAKKTKSVEVIVKLGVERRGERGTLIQGPRNEHVVCGRRCSRDGRASGIRNGWRVRFVAMFERLNRVLHRRLDGGEGEK